MGFYGPMGRGGFRRRGRRRGLAVGMAAGAALGARHARKQAEQQQYHNEPPAPAPQQTDRPY